MTDSVTACLMETLSAMQRAVPYAEGSALAMDPDVLIPIQFAATFPLDRNITILACRNEQREDDVLKFRDLAGRKVPVAALSADHDPECASSPRWQKLLLPRGRRHELRAALVDARGSCWGALALYRKDDTRFSESDVEAVHRLVPGQAARLARALVASRAPGTPATATSLLIADTGEIVGAPALARAWVDEVRRTDEVDRIGMLLASLAALTTRRRLEHARVQIRVRMRSSSGAWTTLLAEPMDGGSLEQLIPVVIMPAGGGQLRPLQFAAFGISDREADVVAHVLDGLDTRAISARLSISSLTVQDHLKSIFRKTGTRSRGELTHLLGA